MARIAGVDLPRDKRIEIGLTYVYGIGLPTSKLILDKAGVNPDTRVKDLSEDEVRKITNIINDEYVVEGDLRREVALNIKRLTEIGCFRGIRHQPIQYKKCFAYESNVPQMLQFKSNKIKWIWYKCSLPYERNIQRMQ